MKNFKFPYTGIGQQTDVTIKIFSDDLSEFGEQKILRTWSGKCDFFEGAKEDNKQSNPASSQTTHTSKIIINGDPLDIKEGYTVGTAFLLGLMLKLKSFRRRRNPDGTVHHILFEVE